MRSYVYKFSKSLFSRASLHRWKLLLYKELQQWGTNPDDDQSLRAKKFNLVAFSTAMSAAGILWGFSCIAMGLGTQSVFPFGYTVVSSLNLYFNIRHKSFAWVANFQIAISLLIPFALQWSLGGFSSSGVVMLWSLMAILGSILVQDSNQTKRWFWVFVFLTVGSMIFDPWLIQFSPAVLTPSVGKGLFLVNLFMVMGLIFNLMRYHIHRSEKATGQLNSTLRELAHAIDHLSFSQEQIQKQSEVIEDKSRALSQQNQALNDSLDYAKRLQEAVFRQHTHTVPFGVQDFFLFDRAYGTVNGDFFWTAQTEEVSVIVLGDCTGHGVPGALLTMLGSSLLDRIVNELGVTDPQTILLKLHNGIVRQLGGVQQDERLSVPGGMDVSVLALYPSQGLLTFSGAFHQLYHIRAGELHVLKGERASIGDNSMHKSRLWTNQVLPYQAGDMLYLSSDGYRDQFGGPKKKRINATKFKQLLASLSSEPVPEQKSKLVAYYDQWKGDEPQTDDVTVVGIRL